MFLIGAVIILEHCNNMSIILISSPAFNSLPVLVVLVHMLYGCDLLSVRLKLNACDEFEPNKEFFNDMMQQMSNTTRKFIKYLPVVMVESKKRRQEKQRNKCGCLHVRTRNK